MQNDLKFWAYPMANNYSCFLHGLVFVFVNYRRKKKEQTSREDSEILRD